jgi:hypothetical protein
VRTVEFRPTGSSMVPLIQSRQNVRVEPAAPAKVEVGDIVLARVAGATYLHLVSAVDHDHARIQISNNRGRVNGWTSHARVYGICTVVNDVPRARTKGKTNVLNANGPQAAGPMTTTDLPGQISGIGLARRRQTTEHGPAPLGFRRPAARVDR